jgi:hypothetical protein
VQLPLLNPLQSLIVILGTLYDRKEIGDIMTFSDSHNFIFSQTRNILEIGTGRKINNWNIFQSSARLPDFTVVYFDGKKAFSIGYLPNQA